jgi:hypothetical protein
MKKNFSIRKSKFTIRDDNVITWNLGCLKELLLAKLNQIDKQTAVLSEFEHYQHSLSMNIVRFETTFFFLKKKKNA